MMGSRPEFRAWLLEQRHRDDPTGDVARDLWYDITTGCMASTEVSVKPGPGSPGASRRYRRCDAGVAGSFARIHGRASLAVP